MPNLNQTGPQGQGPMTGRKMGRCTNYGATQKNVSEESDNNSNKKSIDNLFVRDRGMGYGRRIGHGGGRGYGMGRQNRFRGGI